LHNYACAELKTNMRKLSVVIPIVHLLLYITIGLNIFIFRQITVLVYLSFIPGFVLLKILRLKETSVVDTVLFSVGLSIAFLMFVGLLFNQLCLTLGIAQPLSTIPLVITLSFLTLVLFFVGYRQDLAENLSSIGSNFIDLKPIAQSVILVLPVVLGVIGALYISQPILLLMIIAIAALYALSTFSARLISSKLYPLVIFAISMALTFQLLLISRYIIGWDAQFEYYVFRLTSINGYWHLLPVDINFLALSNFGSMLSVTILPTIYSALMNVNGEIVFKVFYPLVFSLVPVALYRIYERQIGKSASLLSTLLFMSGQAVFYGVEPLSVNRQVVAEFFLVLSIFILLDKRISVGKRRLLLIVFGAALTVSHYSMMFLYLVLVFSIYAISRIKGKPDRVLNGTMVFLLSVIAFLWYTFSISPLTSLSQFLRGVFSRFFTDLYSSAARSSTVFAPHPILNLASMINWVFFYAAHLFILVGILILLLKPAKTKLDIEYRTAAIVSAVILFLCLVVPNIAPALNFQRFYAITLLFLAPCFVLGGATLVDISENVLKRAIRRRSLSNTHKQLGTVVLCAVLIGYFLSQSGFINCVTGASPLSFSLDYDRIRTSIDPNSLNSITFYTVYIPEQNVFSAVWLSKNRGESSMIYADIISPGKALTSYGLIPIQQIMSLDNETKLEQSGLIYLGQLNVVNGIIPTTIAAYNTIETYPLLNALARTSPVYSNGDSEIWYVSSPSQVNS
jgi:uncharacterized membrane protein